MREYHIHLVSDSTGGTLESITKAALSQFDDIKVQKHLHPLVRTQEKMLATVDEIKKAPGLVLYTLVDEGLKRTLERGCGMAGVAAVSILDSTIQAMSCAFDKNAIPKPGFQHKLDEDYFSRMEAVDYAFYHDNGKDDKAHLCEADVILVGVSRTSKTPTCVYLANRGIKAANVPYVAGEAFPDYLLALKAPLFVGLTTTPERLLDIRRNRVGKTEAEKHPDYTNLEKIRAEISEAEQFYHQQGWSVIDVSVRSVEEIAAAIVNLLNDRHTGDF